MGSATQLSVSPDVQLAAGACLCKVQDELVVHSATAQCLDTSYCYNPCCAVSCAGMHSMCLGSGSTSPTLVKLWQALPSGEMVAWQVHGSVIDVQVAKLVTTTASPSSLWLH
jgi:hypothetical protein